MTVGSKVVPLPFEPELWEQAQATRTAWAAAELPPSCAFYNLYGNGVSTPWDCTYGAWWHPLQVGFEGRAGVWGGADGALECARRNVALPRHPWPSTPRAERLCSWPGSQLLPFDTPLPPIQSLASLPAATAAFSYVVGDGTVPAESARAHGLRAVATAEVQKVAHRDLVSSQTVWDQVLAWLAAERAAPAAASAADKAATQGGCSCQHAGSQRSGGPAAAHPGKWRRGEQGQGEEESTFWNPLAWQSVLG